MSTNDVPGANPKNADILAMGGWAEHDDGSLIFVESVEAGSVIYSIFDVVDPPVEYRDAMPEKGFKDRFSWTSAKDKKDKWTWHDKTPFPWDRVMGNFPSGAKHVNADYEISAAQRVAESLNLRAGDIRERQWENPTMQRAANKIMEGIKDAIETLTK